jgi:hypothetical protein
MPSQIWSRTSWGRGLPGVGDTWRSVRGTPLTPDAVTEQVAGAGGGAALAQIFSRYRRLWTDTYST